MRAGTFGLFVIFSILAIFQSESYSQSVTRDATTCLPWQQLSFGRGPNLEWHRHPKVTILGSKDDPRVQHTLDAVDFWNQQLEEAGSGLRIGPVRVLPGKPSDDNDYAAYLSGLVMRRDRGLPDLPPDHFKALCGSIVVVLGTDPFISFARPIIRYGLVIAGIKGHQHFPFTLPNVPRNVIAHEIGHAIGLRHNADETMLMCGRPAPCRPDTSFRSDRKRFFPLTSREKEFLRRRYSR